MAPNLFRGLLPSSQIAPYVSAFVWITEVSLLLKFQRSYITRRLSRVNMQHVSFNCLEPGVVVAKELSLRWNQVSAAVQC
ncbi:hypothetical protein J4Q44_G00378670 [Coregonus suidteri]|uniref:Uncharacterized protein n=1 Tax=Coregonus suidteri TaxID=861788 RepID=A0AAN8KGM5_9TELE